MGRLFYRFRGPHIPLLIGVLHIILLGASRNSLCRYLEDIIPAIGYVPPSVDQQADEKRSRKLENLRQYYGKLSDHALAAVHSVANSKTIDYQV
jgi:hypothetical protein